jgi:uncharacterized membrane protein
MAESRKSDKAMFEADQHLAIFAVIMVIATLALLGERTRIGQHITATVIVILLTIAAANSGIIPHSTPTYDFIFAYIVPLLIPLFLFQADLRRVFKEAARTGLAFLIAALGTTAGALLAVTLLDVSALAENASIAPGGDKTSAIAGLFASTYIGGSVNYAALGEMTGLAGDASFFSAATAADNLFSAVFLSLLALLPTWRWVSRHFVAHTPKDLIHPDDPATDSPPSVTVQSLTFGLAAAAVLVALSDLIVSLVDMPALRYVVLTALTLGLATLFPHIKQWFSGAFELGVTLSLPFFAAIAAGANLQAMLSVAPLLIALVIILLSVHLGLLLVVGKWLGLSLPELITASNAAVLGATTAPVLAAAKGWRDQVTPGVLVGVLGYALGTFVGAAIFQWW